MARNKVIQVACSPALYKSIGEYRRDDDITSDAEALRALALIGLHSLASRSVNVDDDKPSNRALLETILYHVTKESA